MFCEKKNLSVRREKKNSKCEEGEEKKCKCRISGVRKKRKLKEKFREKKIKVFFFWDENFAKFVFTGWVLC